MCGIVGYLGPREAAPILTAALKRLEYRGYDSAGIATQGAAGLNIRRAKGKIASLSELLDAEPAEGGFGIGHTRWATHGLPELRNAHPHMADASDNRVAVVHNGIIENHAILRQDLQASGAVFTSDTDTEVICQLAARLLLEGLNPYQAAVKAFRSLEGSFAAALMFEDEPGVIYVARRGSPLALGRGEGEMFIGSDAPALAPMTRHITYLEDGDIGVITSDGATIFNAEGQKVSRPETISQVESESFELGGFDHFMRKEIEEQPDVLRRTLSFYLDPESPALGVDFAAYDRILMVACGTAYYACLTARYWFEQEAGIPVDVDIASEFRYREPPVPARTLAIFVSQSGETADTLAALEYARSRGATCVALVNTLESSIARGCEIVLPILAGPEIGVASTKAFTCQLTALATLALKAATDRGAPASVERAAAIEQLFSLPDLVRSAIDLEPIIKACANDIATASDVIFLGRGAMHAIALEGALKLKEISYIHAEGYAAGELKHGPIALIEESVPVVALTPEDRLTEKMLSNIEEVMARNGRILAIGDRSTGIGAAWEVEMPAVPALLAPIVYAIPMQLLAYHVAIARGTDVDQPRNLAKSVTTE